MGKQIDTLDDDLRQWIHQQRIFFVATAPLAADGKVNVSPKGGDCLRMLGEKQVAYLDFTGSGAETAAHLRENARITIMFCAFEGPPRILRFHGRGRYIELVHPEYPALVQQLPTNPGARGIVLVDIERMSTSCGFSVPLMDHVADRDVLDTWAQGKGPAGLEDYRKQKNRLSIDGMPAYPLDTL